MQRGITPLADIHLHLYGSIRAEDFLEYLALRDVDWTPFETSNQDLYGDAPMMGDILRRHRQGDPKAAGEFKRLFVFGDAETGEFRRFQYKFTLLDTGSVLTEHLEDKAKLPGLLDEWIHFLRRIAKYQKQEGIGYAEQRLLLGKQFPEDHKRELLWRGLSAYSQLEEPGFQGRLAVGLDREDPWPNWELVRELALGPYGHWLTGIDFCNWEEGHPPKEKAALFGEVHEFNRRHRERAPTILYHVGESFQDKSLESAIRWVHEAAELGAHRLGHAIALGINPDAYGDHQRTESVSERLDQLRYDLKHAHGLQRSGIPVDEQAIVSEIAQMQALPGDTTLTISYDASRLEQIRRRQAFAAGRIREIGAVVEVCPTSNRRIAGSQPGPSPGSPVPGLAPSFCYWVRRSGHLRYHAGRRN